MNTFSYKDKNWASERDRNSVSYIGSLCVNLYKYKIFKKTCNKVILKLEGGDVFSNSLLLIIKKYHNVTIGKYSYGSCMLPGVLPTGTIVGSYCSFAANLRVFRRNHPLNYLSQHPFFYNHKLGLVSEDKIQSDGDNPLTIGSDVWIGGSVIVLPGCKNIGNGAVVGAGSVLTKDVNDFEIVAGNPAKKIKDRYSIDIKNKIISSSWWTKSLLELLDAQDLLVSEVTDTSLNEFLKNT
jgi:virginiamycin A acetyltransferase